jgi:hypothetical protein
MKYWILSLKLQSLMFRETNLSSSQTLMISTLMWSLQAVLFISITILVIFMYLKVDEYETYYTMRYVGYGGVLLTSIASLVFVSDSFRRLQKCVEHEGLGIKKR